MLLFGLNVDRLLGGLCGTGLARAQWSLWLIRIFLFLLDGGWFVGCILAEALEGIQEGFVYEAVIVQPLLAFLVRAAD